MLSCRACHAPSGDDMRYCPTCGESLHDDVPSRTRRDSQVLPAGTVVGSYKLIEVIGEGGMGRVYLAEHTRLGRKVALKMLRSKFSSNAESVKRFFAEARAVNKIAHENIVEVTDFITGDDGTSYYIMELLTGGSLGETIHAEGPLPLERVLHIMIQVTNALDAVHEAGIVHRDLKPDNIFLAKKGSRKDVVKLLDFGIAKLMLVEQGVSVQHTGAGMLLGTPTYMSPEQAGGRMIDHRSDIYATGIILYELATGQAPFVGETYADILVQHITREPAPPSTLEMVGQRRVPPELERLILRCLAKDPADRPSGMSEVEAALRAVLENEQRRGPLSRETAVVTARPDVGMPMVTPTPGGMATPMPMRMPMSRPMSVAEEPARRRGKGLWIGLAAVLLLGGGAAAFAVMQSSTSPSPTPTPRPTPSTSTTPSPRPSPTPSTSTSTTPSTSPSTSPADAGPAAPVEVEKVATTRKPPVRKPPPRVERKATRKQKSDRRIQKGGVLDAFDE
ncbi:MAG TPA: serine/threonine-protein kinase [Kofleriaceae bacterium]|nr:serine/threonine-protein kinase [Kofleriaceae bacterium]